MHVVATNIIIWIRTLIKESLHEIMESEEKAHSLHAAHPVSQKWLSYFYSNDFYFCFTIQGTC